MPGSPGPGVVHHFHFDAPVFAIERLDEAARAADRRVAADPDEHVIANHDRRRGRPVRHVVAGQLPRPALLAGGGVERDHRVVGRHHEQRVAVAWRRRGCRSRSRPRQMYCQSGLAGARIDRVDVIRRREIQDAVHHQRHRLDDRPGRRSRRRAAQDRAGAAGRRAADDRAVGVAGRAIEPGERQVAARSVTSTCFSGLKCRPV